MSAAESKSEAGSTEQANEWAVRANEWAVQVNEWAVQANEQVDERMAQ